MQHSTRYIVGFAITICLVCALFVAGSAVGLRERQEANILLDRQKKVLTVAALMKDGAKLSREEIVATFEANIVQKVIDLKTGILNDTINVADFNQQKAAKDPNTSFVAPTNASKVRRLPNNALVFDVMENGRLKALILP
ncbi:MAG: Na(+)-translocating NADH-quinone reductase subunit C, partial [Myxococcota bacterium]